MCYWSKLLRMFENRGLHMTENDYTLLSALDIFVMDLGVVSREGSSRRILLQIANIAHQLFLSGSAAGWGRLDAAAVVKVYETLSGFKFEGKLPVLNKESLLQSLPPEWPADPINEIHTLTENSLKTSIVLDDDPTGTQTVHDIEVLTECKKAGWEKGSAVLESSILDIAKISETERDNL